MANLFLKQAKQYVATRPTYPPELFDFIASKTPRRDLAWDVGTGSGQAATSLAKLYAAVVGTDTSAQQLSYAPRLPNVRYVHTPPDLPLEALHAAVTPPASVDLVAVAQAFHWLDLPRFYAQARSLLRPRHGVLAAWCYTEPRVEGCPAVDAAFWRLYSYSQPHWAPNRRMVDDEYRSANFPFDPVDGEAHTGPFEFSTERRMDLDDYLTYITSWSAYQTAKDKGVELLDEATVRGFEAAWGGDRKEVKTVTYPIFLRIGKCSVETGSREAGMADLFVKQAEQYAAMRPTYPPELFDFIASKTPCRDLVWDVGTGSGQAAASLARLYRAVVATDASAQQLSHAPRLRNVRYVHTPPDLALAELHVAVAPPASADLVTVAQAVHWFDLPRFYSQARAVLRAPHGVLAVWCYPGPRFVGAADADEVNAALRRLRDASQPYWSPGRRVIDDGYRSLDFPFDPVDGVEGRRTRARSSSPRSSRMDLNGLLSYIRSWSAHATAKEQGVELLDEATMREFEAAWGGDRKEVKTVTYQIFLRIGKLKSENQNESNA